MIGPGSDKKTFLTPPLYEALTQIKDDNIIQFRFRNTHQLLEIDYILVCVLLSRDTACETSEEIGNRNSCI